MSAKKESLLIFDINNTQTDYSRCCEFICLLEELNQDGNEKSSMSKLRDLLKHEQNGSKIQSDSKFKVSATYIEHAGSKRYHEEPMPMKGVQCFFCLPKHDNPNPIPIGEGFGFVLFLD